MNKIITFSYDETKKLGAEFVERVKAGDALLLYGDLGAGKTSFVQGLAQGLGIKDRILSPTFVLQRIHEVPGKKINILNHIDLYRIDEPMEIESLGLEEIFDDKRAVTAIEWADRLKLNNHKKGLSAGRQGYKLYFKYLGDNKREIRIEKI
jgi:tRNA threonylcarbamoyladenosine biosynthesis protein TsaE